VLSARTRVWAFESEPTAFAGRYTRSALTDAAAPGARGRRRCLRRSDTHAVEESRLRSIFGPRGEHLPFVGKM